MADEPTTPTPAVEIPDKEKAISVVQTLIDQEVSKKDMTIDKLVAFHKKEMARVENDKAAELKKLKDAIKHALMTDYE